MMPNFVLKLDFDYSSRIIMVLFLSAAPLAAAGVAQTFSLLNHNSYRAIIEGQEKEVVCVCVCTVRALGQEHTDKI